MNRLLLLTLLLAAVLPTGCRPRADSGRPASHSNNQSSAFKPTSALAALDPCTLVLAPHSGETKTDQEIFRLQKAIPVASTAREAAALIERLGWMFVSKARSSFDPGFYKLAEQCAACLDSKQSGTAEALLLRGHVLQNLHRFKEAEPIAHRLVAERGAPFDFGLLGDVLMEQGRLGEAIDGYQKMIEMKPDAQGYARVAHVRWLKGDLDGALEVMRLAIGAASPQVPESAAWMHSRLAFYELHAGDLTAARRSCSAAFEFQTDYPPALLMLGRIRLADGQGAEAVEPLLRAARLNPLPEYQWTLLEALRSAHRTDEAVAVETDLVKTGAANDPRTFSLFLATQGRDSARAVQLTERELLERADVHTHDALAWALAANGRWVEAEPHSVKALAEGTNDPRLLLHAGIIAAKLGHAADAGKHLAQAFRREQALLPVERENLRVAMQRLAAISVSTQTAANSELKAP